MIGGSLSYPNVIYVPSGTVVVCSVVVVGGVGVVACDVSEPSADSVADVSVVVVAIVSATLGVGVGPPVR
jgi:hypothetical protein